MREDTSSNKPVKKSVAPLSVNHGVNPGWGVYEERPSIPVFNGAAEIGKLALMFTLWSRVESFVYEEVGIQPLVSSKEEKKHRSILLESETYLIALLCLLNNEHYSAGGLVDAMVGVEASADQRGNARKRILNRTLPVVGDRYGLIDYSERHMGNSMEYSICRSERLVQFAETHLLTSFASLFGGSEKSPPKKSAARKSAKATKDSIDSPTASSSALSKSTGKSRRSAAGQAKPVAGKAASSKKVAISGEEK